MTNKEILNQEFERFGCANMLSVDGLMYKAIISAMDRVRQASQNGLENGFSVAAFVSAEQQAKTLSEIDNFLGVPRKEPELTERQKQFYEVANKLYNEIDFKKRGAVAYSLLRFCKEMDGATFSELNMFWQRKDYSNYDSVRDRGGSMTKWLQELQESKPKVYNSEYNWAYLEKIEGKWFTYC